MTPSTLSIPEPSALRYVGVHGGAQAWALAELARDNPQLVIIGKDRTNAEEIVSDLQLFMRDRPVLYFPAWETLPFEPVSPQTLVSSQRLAILRLLQDSNPYVIVTSVDAIAQRVPSPQLFRTASFHLSANEKCSHQELHSKLRRCCFTPASIVEEIGEMAVRGNVIDFFPARCERPVRAEFTPAAVDQQTIRRLSYFDPETQRTLDACDELLITPVRECFEPQLLAQESEQFDKAIQRLKVRGKELEIPPRAIVRAISAFRSGIDFPAIELLHIVAHDALPSFFDMLPAEVPLVLNNEIELSRAVDAFDELVTEREERAASEQHIYPARNSMYLTAAEVSAELKKRVCHLLDPLDVIDASRDQYRSIALNSLSNSSLSLRMQGKVGSGNALKPLQLALERLRRAGSEIAFVVGASQRAERLRKILLEIGFDALVFDGSASDWLKHSPRPPITILLGQLSSGFQLPARQLAFISENEIFGERSHRKAATARTSLKRLMSSLSQLKDNDFVVHIDYGIGVYRGLKHLNIEGVEGDFLHIEYADSRLYLPVQSIGKIQKFSAAEGQVPVLDKLSTATWFKTKQKVKESVITLAGDLIKLYATRSIAKGWRFEPPGAEDERFADGFPFDETPDQLRAIGEVLADLSTDRPMDRLVCGDVGFGKTEVAMRAAFKCAQHARQVAVLVPTTILVEQHRANFANRFLGYPVKIGAVSRFYTSQENKQTLASLTTGDLDIVIGTHRLLSKDVQFKDLGLLIIDEEHRFGVKQKELLKQLKKNVDVLTLTATPIPRTLHMSLLGIRDISIISTPPHDRRVIRTYVAEHSDHLIRDTLLRELQRGGQAFVVHNRIEGIDLFTQNLRELVPEARFEFAHGQMDEQQLENIMQRFIKREIDVLVSTTIVESGLDIPNANTIILDRADTFGLAQLYQLRGRVGRSTRQAYAYLMIPPAKKLGVEAQQRLKALQSLDDLGLGFNLAVRDLEIRGAGNLLGKEQSGSVLAVGFDMYTRILKEAVLNLKGEELTLEETVEPEVKLGSEAFIPDDYIPDVSERLVLYQRLASLADATEAAELAAEIEDRFGPMPEEVSNLIDLMRLRAFLRRAGVTKLEFNTPRLVISMSPRARIDAQKIVALAQKQPETFKCSKNMTLSATLKPEIAAERKRVISFVYDLMNSIGSTEFLANTARSN
ncbi:MAG: transcription-repair coupling factor [Oligoflexia bacterium]|nr:transcription-repair coupling factor [Oligoflexia bacterium]